MNSRGISFTAVLESLVMVCDGTGFLIEGLNSQSLVSPSRCMERLVSSTTAKDAKPVSATIHCVSLQATNSDVCRPRRWRILVALIIAWHLLSSYDSYVLITWFISISIQRVERALTGWVANAVQTGNLARRGGVTNRESAQLSAWMCNILEQNPFWSFFLKAVMKMFPVHLYLRFPNKISSSRILYSSRSFCQTLHSNPMNLVSVGPRFTTCVGWRHRFLLWS